MTTAPAATAPSAATASAALPETIDGTRRQVWRTFAITWKVLCAALLPFRLTDLPTLLPKLRAYFAKYDCRAKPSGLERCLTKLQEVLA